MQQENWEFETHTHRDQQLGKLSEGLERHAGLLKLSQSGEIHNIGVVNVQAWACSFFSTGRALIVLPAFSSARRSS